MVLLAAMLVAAGPVYEPGPVLPEDVAHPRGIEVSQIQRHLANVEATLRRTAPRGATAEQLAARERALDALHEYWTAGMFPQNRDFPDRHVPYFIDAEGTACAVGHLMIAVGDDVLAREIATYENHDFVAEIDHPGVAAWLGRNGLTADEAAWIQPSYGPCGFGEPQPVCGRDGRSYACANVASSCGNVGVQSQGLCPGDTADDILGPEICMADSTGPDESTGSDSGSSSEDEGGSDDKKSCRIGDAPSAAPLLLLALAFRRRR